MRRILFRLSLVWACLGMVIWFSPLPAAAESETVGTSDESWYQVAGCTAVPCATPTPPVAAPAPMPTEAPTPLPTPAVNPFPPGTLHVGILAGQEQSRSYIKLNLASLPFDAKLEGGTLLLPVVAGEQSGTANVAAAKLQACFMEQPFQGGAAGVVATPPQPDCTTKAAANLITQQNANVFTVDLKPFAKRWAAGEVNNGIALMATDETKQAGDSWQVAISGKGYDGPQISAKLNFTVPPPLEQPNFGVPPVALPPVFTAPLPPAPLGAPAPAFPVAAPPAALFTRGFPYPAIFLLPLAGLALSGLLGYSLTHEVAPRAR